MYFQFALFEVMRSPGAWWVQIGGFCFDGAEPAVLYIEHNKGVWRFDFMGLLCLYYWWRDRCDA